MAHKLPGLSPEPSPQSIFKFKLNGGAKPRLEANSGGRAAAEKRAPYSEALEYTVNFCNDFLCNTSRRLRRFTVCRLLVDAIKPEFQETELTALANDLCSADATRQARNLWANV